MANHSINLNNDAEMMWIKHFSKGKEGFQKFSDFVSESLTNLDSKYLSKEEMNEKIREKEHEVEKNLKELEKLKKALESKELESEKNRELTDDEKSWILSHLDDFLSYPLDQEKMITDFCEKFKFKVRPTRDEFFVIINKLKKGSRWGT